MDNKTKRNIFGWVCYLFTYCFLYLISTKTNWFHLSQTTCVVAFLCGKVIGEYIDDYYKMWSCTEKFYKVKDLIDEQFYAISEEDE